jgi:nucleoside-diphosphate-sugar epimerase
MENIVLVAGATGNLGERLVKALLRRGAEVQVLVRSESDINKINMLEKLGAKVFRVNIWNVEQVSVACQGVSCVVSALAGLRDVIIDAQKVLLDSAIASGVARFIPSDYSLDFTRFSDGENRNLDLRREFHKYLDNSSISATTVFNGAFADLLTGQMPLILFNQKIVLYWGNSNCRMDFTTMDDTAEYTSYAALDSTAPRFLRIAGDQINPQEIKEVVSEVTGKKFHLFRAGGKGFLSFIIKIARKVAPGENELYPAWQGMQYMCNMIDERSRVENLDNNLYPEISWTSVRQVLLSHAQSK